MSCIFRPITTEKLMIKTSKSGPSEEVLHLDVEGEKLLSSFSIGDKVTITVQGEIKAISAPRKFNDEDKPFPGSLAVVVSKKTIKGKQNVFAELEEEDD